MYLSSSYMALSLRNVVHPVSLILTNGAHKEWGKKSHGLLLNIRGKATFQFSSISKEKSFECFPCPHIHSQDELTHCYLINLVLIEMLPNMLGSGGVWYHGRDGFKHRSNSNNHVITILMSKHKGEIQGAVRGRNAGPNSLLSGLCKAGT